MKPLQNRIDFCAIISVDGANPNGDPLVPGYPRILYDGHGEISDVCIKRKIRNRLQDMGEEIFVQQDDRIDDGYRSLKARAMGFNEFKDEYSKKNSDPKAIKDITCKKWIDVRTFGQVFPFKGLGSVSTGIRGCMSLSPAISLNIPDIKEYQIIKSTNLDETSDGRKDNATLFYQHRIVESAYVTYGSIHCQLAETNGFTEEDAEKIHHALITLFDNDVSSTRPVGSMNVQRVYWWKHNCKFGQYAPIKVFKTLDIKSEKEYPFFSVTENPLPNLIPDIYIL